MEIEATQALEFGEYDEETDDDDEVLQPSKNPVSLNINYKCSYCPIKTIF